MKNILRALVVELETPRPERPFGSGWLSGAGALLASLTSFVAAVILHWPELLSTPQLHAIETLGWLTPALIAVMLLAYALALISLMLRENKLLGFVALGLAMAAALMGGPQAKDTMQVETPIYFGLDFFVLNMLFTGFLFVPLERLAPRVKAQTLFRAAWREDLFYFLVSSLFVQALAYLTLAPGHFIESATHFEVLRARVGAQPVWLQVIEIMIFTDFVQYWVHRAFHRFPFLWGFHAVHHSAEAMDWLASSRMHVMEIVVLRALTAIPGLTLGFTPAAIQAYLLIVFIYSSLLHANIGVNFNRIAGVLATPRFHHWHHGIDKEAIDVNFAIHFPLFDMLFGTYHMPKSAWPSGYGVSEKVPRGFGAQFLYPFRRKA
jgi:sterol desaturase/sphingolipid hydroxylase (fatty acid hydroxylase superfamily)